ncbi:MAG: hypothetical protein RLQ12_24885 [Cyclobacteriaceae bacterium]
MNDLMVDHSSVFAAAFLGYFPFELFAQEETRSMIRERVPEDGSPCSEIPLKTGGSVWGEIFNASPGKPKMGSTSKKRGYMPMEYLCLDLNTFG